MAPAETVQRQARGCGTDKKITIVRTGCVAEPVTSGYHKYGSFVTLQVWFFLSDGVVEVALWIVAQTFIFPRLFDEKNHGVVVHVGTCLSVRRVLKY